MFEGRRVIVVVPAHNEEKLIASVLDTMPALVDLIVVVDDASSDRTSEVVGEAAARMGERLKVIRHKKNGGVGAAIITGYKAALADGPEPSVVAVMAGDAQMDPVDLPRLLTPLVRGQADYAKGNRLFTGEAWKIIPRHRYLGNAVLSLLTKIASGYWHVADSQSGYTAITSEALALRAARPALQALRVSEPPARRAQQLRPPRARRPHTARVRRGRGLRHPDASSHPEPELAARQVLLLAHEGEVHHPRLPSAHLLPHPRPAGHGHRHAPRPLHRLPALVPRGPRAGARSSSTSSS